MSRLPGLFVTGTDTGVGKTRVAAAIARLVRESGRRVGVLKPVATGAVSTENGLCSADGVVLAAAIGGGVDLDRVTPIVFEEPLAPSVAARRAGMSWTMGEVEGRVAEAVRWWSGHADVLIVEGIGGLLCPLTDEATLADLAVSIDFPLVVVARRGLGTLNHTLLTVEAARLRGLRVAGIILNGAEPTADPIAEATNAQELSRRLAGVAILAEIPHGADPSTGGMQLIHWASLSLPPRRGFTG